MLKHILLLSILVLVNSCASTTSRYPSSTRDEFKWLEEVESKESLDFARAENEKTLSVLKKDPDFEKRMSELKAIYYAKDRVAFANIMKGYFYNFWQDEKHVRGIWRRATISEYKKDKPNWETILDLDKLALSEKENWVWHGSTCLYPNYTNCMISLSKGGKDATTVREFDLEKKEFVEGGFYIPEAKNRVTWQDVDSLYIGTDTGPGSLTDSGYPRTVRLLKRGQKIQDAVLVHEIDKKDQSIGMYIERTPERNYEFISKSFSFYQAENYFYENGVKTLLPMPKSSDFYGFFKGYLLFVLKEELKTSSKSYKVGSLVALPLDQIKDESLKSLEVVFEPTDKKFLSTAGMTKNYLILVVMDNIQEKVVKVSLEGAHSWKQTPIAIGKNGMASLYSTENSNDTVLISYTDFLTPSSLYMGDVSAKKIKMTQVKASPKRFDASDLVSTQKFARSKDGTMIPYFLVHKKNIKLDGTNPTLLYGYGGFEVSMQPYYSGVNGKLWLEKGGVYALANIRGGGEFGPAWHTAATKENHQVVFDDFIAIAEKLIADNVTSPRHLGIQGGSNGGLLVGGTFVQRPDLFNAVVCQVPLLDMMVYHTLLAGASWMDEYGNPDDPKMREIILKYSPYQNVKADVKYPEVYFFTSTKDDRVHPAHARKMVAKMRSQGHPLFYYENIEGGHGGSANLEQSILNSALEYTYLWEKLK